MPITPTQGAFAVVLFATTLTACGAKPLSCGAGTVESNGQCVLRCGAGTVEADGGQCVPACPSGTVSMGGRCAPTAGSACTAAGFDCQDSATALECQASLWVALPCRGPSGCARAGATIQCDMSRNLAGDRCASTAEGRGLCTADGLGTLECRSGALVKTNTCRTCTESGGQIICTP
jgi:hypothetical protein